jgi:hypothetical protein
MKTNKINLSNLHNEEHFQFHTEFKDSLTKELAETLQISEAFATFLIIYLQEKEALQVIRKSANTQQLADADKDRDIIFRGLVDAIKSGQNHFDENKRAAANRLMIVLDQYGNIARKPYNEETAAINKLEVEASTNYAADVTMLNISDWFTELGSRNKKFDTLMKSRYSEEAVKTLNRMRGVRIEIDNVYRSITSRLDALMLINGTTKYEAFVRELNARVDKYNNIIAQRKGRKAKDDDGADKAAK